MLFSIRVVQLWTAVLDGRGDALARALEALSKSGANLEFIHSYRDPARPDEVVVSVTPLVGEAQISAAESVGFRRDERRQTLRLEGPDQPGLGFLAARALAVARIPLAAISVAAVGGHVLLLLAFDSPADAERARARLAAPL